MRTKNNAQVITYNSQQDKFSREKLLFILDLTPYGLPMYISQ